MIIDLDDMTIISDKEIDTNKIISEYKRDILIISDYVRKEIKSLYTAKEISRRLNKPIIDINNHTIEYRNNYFDKNHIITIEYNNSFKDVLRVHLDG